MPSTRRKLAPSSPPPATPAPIPVVLHQSSKDTASKTIAKKHPKNPRTRESQGYGPFINECLAPLAQALGDWHWMNVKESVKESVKSKKVDAKIHLELSTMTFCQVLVDGKYNSTSQSISIVPIAQAALNILLERNAKRRDPNTKLYIKKVQKDIFFKLLEHVKIAEQELAVAAQRVSPQLSPPEKPILETKLDVKHKVELEQMGEKVVVKEELTSTAAIMTKVKQEVSVVEPILPKLETKVEPKLEDLVDEYELDELSDEIQPQLTNKEEEPTLDLDELLMLASEGAQLESVAEVKNLLDVL